MRPQERLVTAHRLIPGDAQHIAKRLIEVGQTSATDLDPGLSILVSRRYIREIEVLDTGRRGRKPSPAYEVNPAKAPTSCASPPP